MFPPWKRRRFLGASSLAPFCLIRWSSTKKKSWLTSISFRRAKSWWRALDAPWKLISSTTKYRNSLPSWASKESCLADSCQTLSNLIRSAFEWNANGWAKSTCFWNSFAPCTQPPPAMQSQPWKFLNTISGISYPEISFGCRNSSLSVGINGWWRGCRIFLSLQKRCMKITMWRHSPKLSLRRERKSTRSNRQNKRSKSIRWWERKCSSSR